MAQPELKLPIHFTRAPKSSEMWEGFVLEREHLTLPGGCLRCVTIVIEVNATCMQAADVLV